jgi:leucyl-tRNA synthetase
MQRNWIGRSIGVQLGFQVHTGDAAGKTIDVFTTRPDTLFGVTYLVVAPEHPLTLALATADQRGAMEAYLESASRKSDLERTELSKEKTGVWTGAFARNPATGLDVPIWVADYVLGGYGCGAVMAVPAHDARDAEFAAVFGLPVLPVISADSASESRLPFTGTGKLMNSCNEAAGLDLNGVGLRLSARCSYPHTGPPFFPSQARPMNRLPTQSLHGQSSVDWAAVRSTTSCGIGCLRDRRARSLACACPSSRPWC